MQSPLRCGAHLATVLCVLAAGCTGALAQRADIGIAAPLSGPSAVLGRQLVDGIRQGLGDDAGAVIEHDTPCTPEGGQAAAAAFVEAGVRLAIGFLCTPATEGALPVLSVAGIPTIAVGPRSERLTANRDRTGLLAWRIAPAREAEAQALAQAVASQWPGLPFGIVEDGSVRARALADDLRAAAAQIGIEPAFIDNYRPAEERQFAIARRILATGVTRLVALGDAADTAIILRDAASLDLDLAVMGGESLVDERADTPLPDGVRALVPDGFVDGGYRLPGEAAGRVAAAVGPGDIAAQLRDGAFDTPFGRLRFDADGNADLPAYGMVEWRDGRFRPLPEG